jgi:hypothetical protein
VQSRNQNSSTSVRYLPSTTAVVLVLVAVSGIAFSARSGPPHEPVAAPSDTPAGNAGDAFESSTSNAVNSVSPPANQEMTSSRVEPPKGPRNVSLQPEALRVGRNLGKRFGDRQRTVFVATGTLTVGGNSQAVELTRKQTERGEGVEIALGGGSASFTWNETDGAQSSGQRAGDIERRLIERLLLDSPDQLVLAQLRGARYQTVARNVRPDEADEAYSGALWDIVRVDDPDQDEQRRPQSRWRLYYINSQTGLVDKVVSELHGEKVEATFSDWRERAGEKFPTRIVWTRQGETLMALSLRNFSTTSAQ